MFTHTRITKVELSLPEEEKENESREREFGKLVAKLILAKMKSKVCVLLATKRERELLACQKWLAKSRVRLLDYTAASVFSSLYFGSSVVVVVVLGCE